MKLFKFENFQITITEEALLVKAFRDIWERDQSPKKLLATLELGYMYFLCDPRSDYMYLVDESTRSDAIILQEGMPKTWKPDTLVKDAMRIYKTLTTTSGSLLLEDTRELIDRVRAQMKEIDLSLTDDKGKPIYTLQTVVATIKQIPGLIEDLNKAEKSLTKELDEVSRMRGAGSKKILEDGFLGLIGGNNEDV